MEGIQNDVGSMDNIFDSMDVFFEMFINRKCSCMNFDWIWMISYQKGISKIDNDYYSVSSKIYELYHEKCSKMEADIVRGYFS